MGSLLAIAVGVICCSPAGDVPPIPRPVSNTAGRSSVAGSSGTSTAGGGGTSVAGRGGSSPASGGGPAIIVGGNTGNGEGAQGGGGGACAAESREGQRIPVDMYFLVDSSLSMDEVVPMGTRWEVVSRALIGFLNDPRNEGTGVGIGYFPRAVPACMPGQDGCLCIPIVNICLSDIGGSCNATDYATPSVPLALPAPIATVIADISAHQLAGGTPTRPAVEGALQYLSSWAEAHPDRRSVLVLATDGEPLGCNANTPQTIAALAADALAGPHAIKTFVIGVGRSLQSLNLIAQAGGTDQAFLVDTGGDVAREFADALEAIRGVASPCDFAVPTEGGVGMTVNPDKVNVRYTPTGATESTLVGQVFGNDPANCAAGGGWYYDDPLMPTTIKLCASTCTSLSGGSVQVEFGCDTIVQPPR